MFLSDFFVIFLPSKGPLLFPLLPDPFFLRCIIPMVHQTFSLILPAIDIVVDGGGTKKQVSFHSVLNNPYAPFFLPLYLEA